MRKVTVRTTNSTMAIWAGILIGVFSLFTGLYSIAALVQGSVWGAVVSIAVGAAGIVLGAVVAVLGHRTSAHTDDAGISWSGPLGASTSVRWEDLSRIVVPDRGDPGDCILLELHDGRILPITVLRKSQAAESTALSPWYLRAGQTLIGQHRAWLETRSG